MRSDKSDIYESNREFDNGYQAEIIVFNVEYIVLIPYTINAIEGLFHIGKTTPLAFFYLLYPIL